VQWQVYPNPSAGIFNLVYQLTAGETVRVKIYDGAGKMIKQYSSLATGFLQKMTIDMQEKAFASGLYLLEASSGSRKQVFRLVKQ
jgi:hypothetical protein